jgi:hypothetical protein
MTQDSERRSPLPHRNRWGFGTGERRVSTFALERAALVAVDLQNDFCAAGGWLASIGVDLSVLRPAIQHTAQLVPVARYAGLPMI